MREEGKALIIHAQLLPAEYIMPHTPILSLERCFDDPFAEIVWHPELDSVEIGFFQKFLPLALGAFHTCRSQHHLDIE